ncbi:MAG: Uma2 family endonuclease [Blastocatellia bacterium]
MTTSVQSALPVEIEIAAHAGAEQRLLLRGVSWETYNQVSRALEPHQPSVSLTYYHGALEIMVASYEHEKWKGITGDIVKLIAGVMEIDYVSSAQTTFQLEYQTGGFEGDDSFYFSYLEQLRQMDEIDLAKDPAPDLVIEIDISNPSINKLPLFADLGISEVWRYHKGNLKIYHLSNGGFFEAEGSAFLPGVTAQAVTELIAASQSLPAYVWQRQVREYAQRLKTR